MRVRGGRAVSLPTDPAPFHKFKQQLDAAAAGQCRRSVPRRDSCASAAPACAGNGPSIRCCTCKNGHLRLVDHHVVAAARVVQLQLATNDAADQRPQGHRAVLPEPLRVHVDPHVPLPAMELFTLFLGRVAGRANVRPCSWHQRSRGLLVAYRLDDAGTHAQPRQRGGRRVCGEQRQRGASPGVWTCRGDDLGRSRSGPTRGG